MGTSARDDASTAKDDADTASSDATAAKGTAQGNYDDQVTVADGTAAAIAAPLSELATLRSAAADAGTDLSTANSAVDDQDSLIHDAKNALDVLMAAHLV